MKFVFRIDISKLLVCVILITGGVFVVTYFCEAAPDSPVTMVGSEFSVCTASVDQPVCYDSTSPTPTINWTFTPTNVGYGLGSQVAYWLEVDNNGGESGVYPSPEINTGRVLSGASSYVVGPDVLEFNTTYYWKVGVKDSFGSISGWTCADIAFTTNSRCNIPPTVLNASVVKGNYCTAPSHHFSWTYSDANNDNEIWYRFQVDNNANFSSPVVDWTRSGLDNPSPTINQESAIVTWAGGTNQLRYDRMYYWRVKVQDSEGAKSDWVTGPSFRTELHQYPYVDMSWDPFDIEVGEEIQFTDETVTYGDAEKASWLWTFEEGAPLISTIANPLVIFNVAGMQDVTLTVTDTDGYSCPLASGSVGVAVIEFIPSWKEILPW